MMYLCVDVFDAVLRLRYGGIGNHQMMWLRYDVSGKDNEKTRDM